jgi:hypothetical protein
MYIKTTAFELEIAAHGVFAAVSLGGRRWEGFLDRTGQGLSTWGEGCRGQKG